MSQDQGSSPSFRVLAYRKARIEAESRMPGTRLSKRRRSPASEDGAQQRMWSGAALQAAVAGSLGCAWAKQTESPVTTSRSQVDLTSPGRRDSREERRNTSWASKS